MTKLHCLWSRVSVLSFAMAWGSCGVSQSVPLAQKLFEQRTPPAAQESASNAPETIEAALKQMSDVAAVIFVGEVKAIRRTSTVVEVEWSVEESIRGCAGGLYIQKEWAGLWAGDEQRYVVGQRSLMMLHAASAAGLSTPVPDGVIPVQGEAIGGTVDLRWVMSHVVRSQAMAGGGVNDVRTLQQILPSEDTGLVRKIVAMHATTQRQDASAALDGRAVDREVVTGLLRVWGRS